MHNEIECDHWNDGKSVICFMTLYVLLWILVISLKSLSPSLVLKTTCLSSFSLTTIPDILLCPFFSPSPGLSLQTSILMPLLNRLRGTVVCTKNWRKIYVRLLALMLCVFSPTGTTFSLVINSSRIKLSQTPNIFQKIVLKERVWERTLIWCELL